VNRILSRRKELLLNWMKFIGAESFLVKKAYKYN